ncbi:MAG TPA: DUF420 domain-containing protein [Candidatus Marinimicrobia bacterium]|nr:MAG: hypothetical protein AUJ47_02180 [Candidatus Marinimicrobia bacterium CG1_02_48_14]PJA55079.1 MAG: DUF420 domain-containing protein [Candidatus Marinimicrobia bacterium CG_4_9_14_3_um_filter_48_9]HCW76404.1 DUF420 domain-containing protein [Candidatus Neomarinimicrobiota bacterium]
MTPAMYPPIIAFLNLLGLFFLVLGRNQIKKGHRGEHKKLMLCALASSALFLVIYLIYHAQVGSVPYPLRDWTRVLYFLILFPHILLAALMVPFILAAVWFALKGRFEIHRKLVKWVWPVWAYVSVTGVLVYIMLYLYAGAGAE